MDADLRFKKKAYSAISDSDPGTIVFDVVNGSIHVGGDEILYSKGSIDRMLKNLSDAIPTALSQLSNDTNFITNTVNDLANYYLKSETYTKSEVNSLLGSIGQFKYEIYTSTSDITDPQSNVLYLIGPTGSGSDKYEEYVYSNNTFVKIGDTSIDLSSYYTKTEADNKFVAQVSGKGLSTEDYTSTEKNKLAGIADGAEVNVNADWNANSGDAEILNKPTLATVATSGDYDDLQNKPTIPAAQVNSDWNASSGVAEILNKPSLATVATSGSYTDLSDTPSIPAAQIQSDWNQSDNTSLDYIKNKPTIPAAQVNADWNSVSGLSEILNKPTIPTVNDGTLSLQAGGVTKKTFSANQSTSETFNIASGTANGTISVGGTDVAVTGLGSMAYDSGSYIPLSGGTASGSIGATSFVKTGASSSDFLKGDGSTSTLSVVGSSSDGLAPQTTTADVTISTQSTERVLTSVNGATPVWKKLPAEAFIGGGGSVAFDITDTTVTTSESVSYSTSRTYKVMRFAAADSSSAFIVNISAIVEAYEHYILFYNASSTAKTIAISLDNSLSSLTVIKPSSIEVPATSYIEMSIVRAGSLLVITSSASLS